MNKKLSMLALASVLAAPMAAGLTVNKANAASLTDVTIGLDDSSINAQSEINVFFTPVTAITDGTILEVSYDTAFTGGASLTNSDITVSGTNINSGTTTCSGFIAGYFTCTLDTSANVTSLVTINIAPVLTNPATGGNYNWTITADISGLGTTFDSGSGLAYINDANDVNVTATVVSVIDMELYEVGSDTLLSDPNTCSLGVLSINSVNTCAYDIGYGTNSAAGLTVKVTSDGALNSGANDINACSGTNCDGAGAAGVTAGQEEYGFQVSDAGTGCSATIAGSFTTADQAVPTVVTNLFSNAAICEGTSTGQSATRVEVTHKAAVSASTATGSYEQQVTYTAFSN